jgi:hypothetical protein
MNEQTLEQRREELLAAALAQPGVADATRVFEALLSQSPNDGRTFGTTTRYATGGNA